MQLNRKVIYIISPEPWGTNFVSKHHYASLLSENNEVFFLNPPTNNYCLTTVNSCLTVVDYTLPKGLNRLPQGIRFFVQQCLAKQLMKKLLLPTPDIIWSFDPYVFQNLKSFNSKAVKIYHPVDVHYTNLEFDLIKSANVVFSTAHLILDKFKVIDKPKYFINHGLANHFIQLENPLDEFDFIDEDKAIKIGYVGNLRYLHLDYLKLFQTIESHPTCHFYFVGPYESSNLNQSQKQFDDEIEQLKKYDNVFLLGANPSSKIPSFLSKMDMLWMCYKGAEKPAEMANPHKMLEYLSSGKPVVTHYIDEYKDLAELIVMVDDHDDYLSKFSHVVAHLDTLFHQDLVKKRKKFASLNLYKHQLAKIEKYIAEVIQL